MVDFPHEKYFIYDEQVIKWLGEFLAWKSRYKRRISYAWPIFLEN